MCPRRRTIPDHALAEQACTLLVEAGAPAVTFAQVSKRGGIAPATLVQRFGTREGLLVALYRDYDRRVGEAIHAALAASGGTFEEVAAILSAAYVGCRLSSGTESGAIWDALAATEEMERFRRSLRDSHVVEFRKVFAPVVKLPRRTIDALLLGILGAADTVAEAAAAGRLSRADAVAALTRIMVGALAPPAGRQSTASSIFRANSKSLSVMPPAECVFSFTQSLPQVTARSGWCQAASAR